MFEFEFEFELELVNVANVKISSSNVANFQLGIGIGIGNISTLATFTSVGVGEWNFWKQPGQAVGAGRRPYRGAIGLTAIDYRLAAT